MFRQQNGIGICSWDEWRNNMSEDQRQYEIHRNLVMLNRRTTELTKVAKLYAFTGGMIGGGISILAVLGAKITLGL